MLAHQVSTHIIGTIIKGLLSNYCTFTYSKSLQTYPPHPNNVVEMSHDLPSLVAQSHCATKVGPLR